MAVWRIHHKSKWCNRCMPILLHILGTIQVLHNAVGGGRVSDFPEKKRYEDVRFNVISVMMGWVVVKYQKKTLRYTWMTPYPQCLWIYPQCLWTLRQPSPSDYEQHSPALSESWCEPQSLFLHSWLAPLNLQLSANNTYLTRGHSVAVTNNKAIMRTSM